MDVPAIQEMRAIITVGISCSGKSTWAKKYCEETGALEINRDEIRMDLFNLKDPVDFEYTREKEMKVIDVQRELIRSAAYLGKNVVISDTNLNEYSRDQLASTLISLGYDAYVKIFEVDLEVAIERNRRRKINKIPEEVIRTMYEKFQNIPDCIVENPWYYNIWRRTMKKSEKM